MAENTIQFKCPNCAGPLNFDSTSQRVVCPYCETEFQVSDLNSYREELQNEDPEEMHWESNHDEYTEEELNSLRVFHCESCGGELVCDENTSATKCPYCQSPVILAGRLSGSLKPDYIIPFKRDKQYAEKALQEFYKKKLFLPKRFIDENKVEEIKGIYVPFWVHNADANAMVKFRGEKRRSWRSGDYRYVETSYYSIIRRGELGFDHIPVDGSKKMPDNLMESIEPFSFQEAERFKPAYLSGYLADKYDVEKEECLPRVNTRIKEETVKRFRSTVHGYNVVNTESVGMKLFNTKVFYSLYPVWTLNTKWNDQKYSFAMNGQSGKMVGNLPLSKWKYFLWFMLFYLVSSVAVFGIAISFTEGYMPYQILISLGFGFIAPLIFCRYHRRKLKPVVKQNGAASYYRENSMRLFTSKDIFLYKRVTKTKVVTQNNTTNHRK